ncbi:right-handed parallel beta-helix repeat-containing protein [Natrialbaceae archaeon AArc-T1-2]|uniref:right-handed parallel beta-helix repeat-containing protein n=1 Tax=Natrialbaceae archaeon AArc-T1-2 TaxID=3053904 RepID=UPI00255A9647|nr:right-handed parallel beta-helix repeat-containing protein [Natrialbaceae archaeon AArc-T1-2]WIV67058.1 right-handed parallel beta-helix repeat-containing protein [Natrialbaceae archaeon AArc-T1-2]
MAREPSVLDDYHADRSSDEGPTGGGNDGLLHRRSYLKLAGATAAVAAGTAAAGTAAADEYEVVELEPGELRTVRLDDGETHENVLYDQRANNAQVRFRVNGSDWTIRNIGVVGPHKARGSYIGCSVDAGSTGRIENVYLGDGAINQSRAGLGIYVAPRHSGHLEIKNVYVEGMGDNSFYCSPPGGSGTVHIDGCYSKNSWVAHYRLARGQVTNSVAVNDGGGQNGRGLWAWAPGPVEVRDCHFVMNGRHNALVGGASNRGSEVEVYDTEWDDGLVESNGSTINLVSGNGRDPEDVVPDGCPTSAEEAASGGSGSSGDAPSDPDETDETDPADERDHVLVADGEPGEPTDYELTVDGGPIEPSAYDGATINDNISIADDEAQATGRVYGGVDAWAFDGDLETLEADGPATFALDGEEIDPDDRDDDDSDANVLLFDGSEEATTRYEFVVSGDVAPSTDEGATVDDEATVEDGTASGVVANWKDAWRFDGDLEELTVDGPATVVLDGEELDPDEYGDRLPHTLEIEAGDEPASYEVTVDGEIEYDGDDDVTVVSGTTVESSITEDVQRFHFAGTITAITVTEGSATVRVDGEEIDSDEYGEDERLPHALVVDGTEASGPSVYSIHVDGTLAKASAGDANHKAVVSDGTVRGVVADWNDAYWFDGEVEDVTVLGEANVDVEYNARDQ